MDTVFPAVEAAETLVLASVSVGCVAQLALELIVETVETPLLSTVSTTALLPIAAPPTHSHTTHPVTVALEAFQSRDKKFLLLQQRSDFVRSKRKAYLDELVDWIKQCKFKRVVLLSSSYSAAQTDVTDENRLACRYLCSSQALPLWNEKTFENQLPVAFVPPADPLAELRISMEIPGHHNTIPSINGGGIARSLYNRCEAEGLPLLVLVKYTMEGEGEEAIKDATQLADFANHWLQLKPVQKTWKQPPSWKLLL